MSISIYLNKLALTLNQPQPLYGIAKQLARPDKRKPYFNYLPRSTLSSWHVSTFYDDPQQSRSLLL